MPISYIETASLDTALNAPTATALSTASGSAPSYSARAWVNFNGTGTVAIRASGNVTSITDNGTGDYTVNFTTAMADANYTISGVAGGTVGDSCLSINTTSAPTVNAVRVYSFASSSALVDNAQVHVQIFR
jgi:hypothetical protein